MNYNL